VAITLRAGLQMKQVVVCVFISILAFFLGVSLACFSLREQIFIDYVTGNMRRAVLIGPVILRDQPFRAGAFQDVPVSAALSYKRCDGMSGDCHPEWRLAFEYWRDSRVSSSYNAGRVVNEAARLGKYFRFISEEEAVEIKREFLRRLCEYDQVSLSEWGRKTEAALLERIEGKRGEWPAPHNRLSDDENQPVEDK
jgi:hypothetical protein